ncbi:ABC transporter permease [Alloyangia pacifica]|uniref:ABC transporter permease n=1 Tax=Alloyangia pacifica TaxID=311180 RepID=UPI001CFCB547|nr:ABC transporter permease [Alloyangia pacifica]
MTSDISTAPLAAPKPALPSTRELAMGKRIWLATRSSPWFLLGAGLFGLLLLMALVSVFVFQVDPTKMNFVDKFTPPIFSEGANPAFPLGTDQLGRDMLSRALVGLQITFLIGLAATALSFVIGSAVGLYAGFVGGKIDQLLMRVVDIQMSIPPIILAITILGLARATPALVIAVLVLATWPNYARLTRAGALAERGQEYVRAARVLGASDIRIILLMVAPVALPPMAFAAVFDLARMMIFECVLDFLGIGLQPPTPTLGVIIADGRKYLINAWWIAVLPGVFLMLLLLSLNMMGTALERARNAVFEGAK